MKCFVDTIDINQKKACFALELLLEGLGYNFQQVGTREEADIAYTRESPPQGILWIKHTAGSNWDISTTIIETRHNVPILYESPEVARSSLNLREGGLPDIVYATYALITGAVERGEPKQQWGVPIAAGGLLERHGCLDRPVVARYEKLLGQALLSLGIVPGIPLWPHGKRYAVTLSHDIDEPFYFYQRLHFRTHGALKFLRNGDMKQAAMSMLGGLKRTALAVANSQYAAAQDPNMRISEWREIEASIGVQSAFYVAVTSCASPDGDARDVQYDYRTQALAEAIQRAAGDGWEIGLHASINAHRSTALLEKEKEKLQRLLPGQAIDGIRHHYWSLDRKHPERTLWLQSEAGFKYDSSLGLTDRPGPRRGVARPFTPFDYQRNDSIPILEVPSTVMDRSIFDHVPDQETGYQALRNHVRSMFNHGSCVTFNWHAEVLNPLLVNGAGPMLVRLLKELAEDTDIFWCSPKQLVAWWQKRRQIIQSQP